MCVRVLCDMKKCVWTLILQPLTGLFTGFLLVTLKIRHCVGFTIGTRVARPCVCVLRIGMDYGYNFESEKYFSTHTFAFVEGVFIFWKTCQQLQSSR